MCPPAGVSGTTSSSLAAIVFATTIGEKRVNIIKWFRNRRRHNRRLALVKIGWVAILLLCAGCSQTPPQQPIFQRGQIVDLRIGRRGQILHVWVGTDGPKYSVRVNSERGPTRVVLQEFELRIVK